MGPVANAHLVVIRLISAVNVKRTHLAWGSLVPRRLQSSQRGVHWCPDGYRVHSVATSGDRCRFILLRHPPPPLPSPHTFHPGLIWPYLLLLSVSLSLFLSVSLCLYLSVCLCVSISLCVSVCVSLSLSLPLLSAPIVLSVSLCVCLSVCLSVCLFLL